jgi:hypothetical protein
MDRYPLPAAKESLAKITAEIHPTRAQSVITELISRPMIWTILGF